MKSNIEKVLKSETLICRTTILELQNTVVEMPATYLLAVNLQA